MQINTIWNVNPITIKKTVSEILGGYNVLIGKKIGVMMMTRNVIMWIVVKIWHDFNFLM
jgi:hypothetical protein